MNELSLYRINQKVDTSTSDLQEQINTKQKIFVENFPNLLKDETSIEYRIYKSLLGADFIYIIQKKICGEWLYLKHFDTYDEAKELIESIKEYLELLKQGKNIFYV